MFGTEDKGDRLAEIGLEKGKGSVWGGNQGGDGALLEEGEDVGGGCADERQVEKGALGGADGVGIKRVAERIGEEAGIGAGGIGGAKDSAEVTRFFDTDENDEKRVVGCGQIVEGAIALVGDCEEAVGRLTVGDLGEDLGGHGDAGERGRRCGVELVEEVEGLGIGKVILGKEEGIDGPVCLQGALAFAEALDEEEALALAVTILAEAQEVFDAGILAAGDALAEIHEGKAWGRRSGEDEPFPRLWVLLAAALGLTGWRCLADGDGDETTEELPSGALCLPRGG